MGHSVDFWVARGAWPIFKSQFPRSKLISSDNIFRFAPENLSQTWRFLPAFAWRMVTPWFARSAGDYDVVFACAQFVYEVGPAIRLANDCSAALVAKIHHVISSQRASDRFFDRLSIWSERIASRWLNRRFHALLCSTPQIGRNFNDLERDLRLEPSLLHPTGYGVRLDSIPFNPDHPKEFDAVVLGRVHEHKGVLDLPQLWRLVRDRRPEARLAIVGEGPHRRRVTESFSRIGLGVETQAVHFTGGIDDSTKNAFLAKSRIGLSLSREEGWGLSIMEYLGAGLPVIAMEVPVFADIFLGRLDIVPQRDIPAMADKIIHWLDHPDLARQGALERRQFVERYDYRQVARRELAIMEDAVARHRAGLGPVRLGGT